MMGPACSNLQDDAPRWSDVSDVGMLPVFSHIRMMHGMQPLLSIRNGLARLRRSQPLEALR